MDILEKYIWDNVQFNPFEKITIDMTGKRNKFKKEIKTLLQTLTKNCSNSVYVGCIRRDIGESYKRVSQRCMKNEYKESVKEWFLLKLATILVEIKNTEGVDDEGISKKSYLSDGTTRIKYILEFEKTNE